MKWIVMFCSAAVLVLLMLLAVRVVYAADTCDGYRLAITMNCASDAILVHCRDRSPFVQGKCIDVTQDQCEALKDEVRRNCRSAGSRRRVTNARPIQPSVK